MDENTETIANFEQLLQQKSLKKPLSIYKDQRNLKLNDGGSNCVSLANELMSSVTASLKAMQSAETVRLNKNVRKNLDKYKKHVLLPLTLLDIEDNQPQPSTSTFDAQCVTDTQLIDVIERAEAIGGDTQRINNEFDTSFTKKCTNNDDSTIYFDTTIEVETEFLKVGHHGLKVIETDKISTNDSAEKRCIDSESTALSEPILPPQNKSKNINLKQMEHNKNEDTEQMDTPKEIELNSEVGTQIKTVQEEQQGQGQGSKGRKNLTQDLEGIHNQNRSTSPILSLKTESSSSPPHLVFESKLFEDFQKLMMSNGTPNFEECFMQSQILGKDSKTKKDKHLLETQNDDNDIIQFDPSPILGNANLNQSDEDKDSPVAVNFDMIPNNNVPEQNVLKTSTPDIDDFLKDEILFSSDEESDYIHKDIQELPFTCVLETSFYNNQSHVLEKNMYIDFDRRDSTDSVQDDNVEGIQLSVAELVEMCERDSGRDKAVDSIRKERDNVSEKADNTDDISVDNIIATSDNLNKIIGLDGKDNMNRDFVGFKTASNKAIEVSVKAREQMKQVFQDIDLGEDILCFEPYINQTDERITKQSKITEIFDNKEKELEVFSDSKMDIDFSEIDWLENINKKQESKSPEQRFKGFTTASNKSITISEKALAKTRKIFKNIDVTEQSDPKYRNDVAKEVKTSDLDSKNDLIGFKTASNKKINILEESLVATKKIFQDIDSVSFDADFYKPSTSKVAQNRVFSKMEEQPKFVGFQTASNKKVEISKKALDHCKNIFKDIGLDDDFTKSDGKNAKFIEEKVSTVKDFENFKQPQDPVLTGFQTASKKPVNITKDTINNTKDIFKDIDEEKSAPVFKGFQTASKKPVVISKDALEKTKALFKDLHSLNESDIQVFKGFQTASNKQVAVSKDAIEKSKDLFKDLDTFNASDTSVFKGFQTASKKPVKISADAIKKTKEIFNDIDYDKEASVFKGFQTASNKQSDLGNQIEISKDKDDKTRSIEHNTNMRTVQFKSFTTASNKKVNITEESLVKNKKVFDGLDLSPKFQTASKKKVQISQSALQRTKRIFQDFEDNFDIQNADDEIKETLGFKTANNKGINVSEDALAKSKLRLANIDQSQTLNSINQLKTRAPNNQSGEKIEQLINTQVINNFAEDLNTEDFCKTPVKENAKRAGSPILSCPKAKKRKVFVTPYKVGEVEKVPEVVKPILSIKSSYTFDGSYKKAKLITMSDVANLEKQSKGDVNNDTRKYNLTNAIDYAFEGARNTMNSEKTTVHDIKKVFLDSVNRKIVPDGWVENHYSQIVWKLLQYETKYPITMENVCNTNNVMEQLKHRYDRELYKVERSALRKIMEKDETSARSMVLSVASLLVDGVPVDSVNDLKTNIEVILTDGWYSIRATIDKMLSKLVYDNKIVVGAKLITNGAELVNCEQGVSPWEDTSNVRLKIFGNSTRRAKWDAKLGFHGNAAILVPLSTVRLDGGKVSKLRVLVTRVYPMLYVEKFEDGSTVTRSEKLEQLHQMRSETDRQILMEKIYEQVEKEFEQESQDSIEHTEVGVKRKCTADSGSQIAKMLKRSRDPIEFRAQLTDSQNAQLLEYTTKQKDRMLQEMRARAGNLTRNVATLCKMRVADVGESHVCCGMMAIWRPGDAILEILKEGEYVDVLNVFPTAMRNTEIQLTAGRQSVFSRAKVKQTDKTKSLLRICHVIKDLVQNPTQKTDFNEIDCVGLVVEIEPSNSDYEKSSKTQNFQNVYLADSEKNIICLNFWGGIKKFGFQTVVDTGQVVYATNLQKRVGNTRKRIPHFRVTEFSWFTKTPKTTVARDKIEALQRLWNTSDRRQFVADCLEHKNKSNNSKYTNENISPYRPNMSDYNLTKNRMYIESLLAKDMNLTGLDFESTFKQTDTQGLSPEEIARKKRLNEKMAKLRMYGEPPPLSPVLVLNKSKSAGNDYKSPMSVNISEKKIADNSDSSLRTSEVRTTSDINYQNVEGSSKKGSKLGKIEESVDMNQISLGNHLNRTFVKRSYANPVKLNFSGLDESETDHFAEDFDGSPPLSLD